MRAVCYTVGSDDQKVVAYLERYTEAGREILLKQQTDPNGMGDMPPQMEVRKADRTGRWEVADSAQGQEIMKKLQEDAAGASQDVPLCDAQVRREPELRNPSWRRW